MTRAGKSPHSTEWDYLIITASNELQADGYKQMIGLRQSMGMLSRIGHTLVIADPGGRRIGSGGSTIQCLLQILNREIWPGRANKPSSDPSGLVEILDRLRILIVHAGGDSRRLPPYGPCGKIFIPIPGETGGAFGTTLFDNLLPTYLRLPRPSLGSGQVVVGSGDVLLNFDAAGISFAGEGITGVGALAQPEVAKNHGVYCPGTNGRVRLFLQKPSISNQVAAGGVGSHGQAVLDIGILNFSPQSAARLLGLCGVRRHGSGKRRLAWQGPLASEIETKGLDIYREICCALGKEPHLKSYIDEVRGAGSALSKKALVSIFRGLRSVPFQVHTVPRLRFLHFGTLQELIDSGRTLVVSEMGEAEKRNNIIIDSRIGDSGDIIGKDAWVEGCRISAPLTLAGDNLIVGGDVTEPLALPRGGCLDVIAGKHHDGRYGWFVRLYSTGDTFHLRADKGARLCGLPVLEWLKAMDSDAHEVWGATRPAEKRTVWNGRFFPWLRANQGHQDWLFLLDPAKASKSQKLAWREADRYSFEEIALRADLGAFHARRSKIRGELAREALARLFLPEGGMSAREIAYLIDISGEAELTDWILSIVREAVRIYGAGRTHPGLESLGLSRILHTLGTVLEELAGRRRKKGRHAARGIIRALEDGLTAQEKKALPDLGIFVSGTKDPSRLSSVMKEAAFRYLGRTIVFHAGRVPTPPKNVLRSDEIVWGRAPARLDLGGGWTDTPPYSLERGGCVINAAVDLNGQAPIQAYARVIDKSEIHINSIDHSTRAVVKTLDELMDYRKPESQFSLAKAALALAGFSPQTARWPRSVRSLDRMLRHFGGGIELTTLAAIPSGSGLGTSSIMGAVLMSIIGRVVGRPLTSRELFHSVLKLEQELTTGGGWQDQIGGAVEGVKMITAEKGLVPDPRIQFVPAGLLDPAVNGGRTLLYYTGLRRLAKNILHDVVGRYLDRDRSAMETLRRLHEFPPMMAEAMATREEEKFGELLDVAWQLNVDLDPDHTTPVIEELRARIRPHVWGAKLLGAGGGGFLLMVCKSIEDAAVVRQMLEKRPPNDRARFFDYSINKTGLVVTVC